MGKISQGILDGVSGKVGNVIGASWKGIDYLRIKPDHISNPRTIAQVNQRTRFKGVSTLAKRLLSSVVRPIWDRTAVKMTGYNLFIKTNIEAFGTDGNIEDYSKLIMSVGSLATPETINVSADENVESGIKIAWFDSLDDGDREDQLMIVAIDPTENQVYTLFGTGITRGEGMTNMVLPFKPRTEVSLYIFFRDAEFRKFSPSAYSTVTI